MDPEQELHRYRENEVLLFVWETIKVVILSLAIIIPVRYFLIQPFFVNGQSMEPNFEDKDYIIVNRLDYRLNKPKRGDVIVFLYPKDFERGVRTYFIKRVVGLPNETVQVKNDTVTIYNDAYPEGFILDETGYLPAYQETKGDVRMKLDPDEYFVLGDNRLHSSDSRVWGPLHGSLLSGRAAVRLWPLDEVAKIPRVMYGTE